MRNMVIIFPGIGPVLFIHNSRLQFANKLRSQAGQVPQALGHTLSYLFLLAISGQICAYLNGLPAQYAILLPLVQQLDRLFDCHPAGGVAT